MTAIARRRPAPDAIKVPTILRFATGKVVDPARCPNGISAHGHWRLTDVDELGVNTTCDCEPR